MLYETMIIYWEQGKCEVNTSHSTAVSPTQNATLIQFLDHFNLLALELFNFSTPCI